MRGTARMPELPVTGIGTEAATPDAARRRRWQASMPPVFRRSARPAPRWPPQCRRVSRASAGSPASRPRHPAGPCRSAAARSPSGFPRSVFRRRWHTRRGSWVLPCFHPIRFQACFQVPCRLMHGEPARTLPFDRESTIMAESVNNSIRSQAP